MSDASYYDPQYHTKVYTDEEFLSMLKGLIGVYELRQGPCSKYDVTPDDYLLIVGYNRPYCPLFQAKKNIRIMYREFHCSIANHGRYTWAIDRFCRGQYKIHTAAIVFYSDENGSLQIAPVSDYIACALVYDHYTSMGWEKYKFSSKFPVSYGKEVMHPLNPAYLSWEGRMEYRWVRRRLRRRGSFFDHAKAFLSLSPTIQQQYPIYKKEIEEWLGKYGGIWGYERLLTYRKWHEKINRGFECLIREIQYYDHLPCSPYLGEVWIESNL